METVSSARATIASRSPYLWAIPAALVLMLFSFVNGYAVFFIDSKVYVRSAAVATDSLFKTSFSEDWRPSFAAVSADAPASTPAKPARPSPGNGGANVENNGITANRSIYYGILAFVGYVSSNFWGLIAFQAYVAAAAMALLAMRVAGLTGRRFLAISAMLTVTTCVGPFVAYIMPDIFGATTVLCGIALLVGWKRLTNIDRAVLFGIASISVLSHNSNVLLLGSIVGAWFLWALLQWRERLSLPQFATIFMLLAVGPIGLALFGFVIKHQTGQAPLVIPHMTAHLVDLGPGTAYVKTHCKHEEFAVCKFSAILPVQWEQFIGGAADKEHGVFSVADLPTKRRLSDEQLRFAAAVLATYPVQTVVGLLGDGARQLGTLTIEDMKLGRVERAYFSVHMPPTVWKHMESSTIYSHPDLLDVITVLTYLSSLVGLAYIMVYLYQHYRSGRKSQDALLGVAILLLVAILANAAICGILASPMGRFSARLIWLLPLVALMMASTSKGRLVRERGA